MPSPTAAQGQCAGREGDNKQLQGRTVPQATRGPTPPVAGLALQQQRFGFPLICRTFGSLFSIKNKRAVLTLSRTLPLRLLFCTAHWADLEGERNQAWKLQCSGGLAVWQNFLTRGTHVMPFPLLFSSAQASVSTSLHIIWKWHMEEVRFEVELTLCSGTRLLVTWIWRASSLSVPWGGIFNR